uniref:Uncharacterized protein n=1 Tax=Strigamia maritima TaxID=126957 RepID=T1J9C4_STRMM
MKYHRDLPTWSEWNDNDINSEKWDSHSYGTHKKEPAHFEDPDGNDWFPAVLGTATSKRPSEIIHQKLLRLIISHIVTLVNLSARKSHLLPEAFGNTYSPPENIVWKPWHHVYSLCKTGKVSHNPVYNPWGKYVVRLFWMGCWRKIYVDDIIPMSLDGRCLLPFSNKPQELWPAILVKAILKVASLDRHHQSKIWEILLSSCPRFEWPAQTEIEKENFKKCLSKIQTGEVNIDYNPSCVAVFADLHTFGHDNTTKHGQKMNTILQVLSFSSKMRHAIYVSEVRTIPLVPPQTNEEIPAWKLIRRHLWDENYMTVSKQIKCLGLFLPWSVSEIVEDKRDAGPREREFSTIKNPTFNWRMMKNLRKDATKFCESIQIQWITFEDFCKSFCVYHKPSSYNYWYKLMDMKIAHSKSSAKLLSASMGHQVQSINDGLPFYICKSVSIIVVSESLEKTEIFISFSVCGIFPNRMSPQASARKDSISSLFSFSSNTNDDDDKPENDIAKGYLIVNTFDWQRQMPIQIMLTLKTAATTGSFLCLPPGRHVLVITTRSPFGCYVNICSNSPLVVGEDDVIYPKISSESMRFILEAENILLLLSECFSSFGNMKKFAECEEKLYSSICPKTTDSNRSSYYLAFVRAIFLLISRVLDSSKFTPDVAYALRVFTLLPYKVVFRDDKSNVQYGKKSFVGNGDTSSVVHPNQADILKDYSHWTVLIMLIKLQKHIRRFLVQNVMRGRLKLNSKFHKRTVEQLLKLSTVILKLPRENGIFLLRTYFHLAPKVIEQFPTYFHLAPKVIEQFPFYSDECNCALIHEYTGVTNFIPHCNSWLVVFREYYIEIKVLNDSWLVDPVYIPFIQALQLKNQFEIHLGLSKSCEEITAATSTIELLETESRKPSIDQRKPYWLLKIIAENNLAELISVKRDTRRIEKIRAIKTTWEDDQPGRFTKANNARFYFLKKYEQPSTGRSSEKKLSGREADSRPYCCFQQTCCDVLPRSINTKVQLKSWDMDNFVKRLRPDDKQTLKDNALVRLQKLVQNKLSENFNTWRNGAKAEFSQMKLKLNCEKALLYDTHKHWQKTMSIKRKKELESREVYRLRIIEDDKRNESIFMKSVEELQLKYQQDVFGNKKDAVKKK